MPRFCSNCGAALPEDAKFCSNCGATIQTNPAQATARPAQADSAPVYAGNGPVRQGIPVPGYSDRVNDPKILAAVKKNRKAAGIFSLILVPLPLIGFAAYSIFGEKLELPEALKYGGIVSAVFLVFALYGFLKERAKNTYEATVIDKKTREVLRHKDSESGTYTEYITVVRTTDGKKKKIVEREGSQIWAWNYLNVGDRFQYHPQFHFPYELYDKSKAPYLACVSCGSRNPIEADCCQKCGLPLLK